MNKSTTSYWCKEFRKVKNSPAYQKWFKQASKLSKMYRNQEAEAESDEYSTTRKAKYNLLYRNIKVKMPYLVPFIPTATVTRQNQDSDPVARCSSEILERSCNKFIEDECLKQQLDKVKLDSELCGIGQLWVNYSLDVEDTELGPILKSENIDFEYINCFDYLHNVASKREEITWVAKRVRLSKSEFKKRFPDVDVSTVPFTSNTDLQYSADVWSEFGVDRRDRGADTISIWEVWDKTEKKVYCFAPVMQSGDLLEEKDYPYDIEFPCVPEGLMFDEFNDNLIPTPRHAQCLDQYEKIDYLTNEIFEALDLIGIYGAYDESCEGFDKIFDPDNKNSLVAIKDAIKYVEKGGLAGAMTWYDPTAAINVITSLNTERDLLIKDVQGILGVYDVLEGETNPQEAYGTNKLKGTFGTQRLQEDQSKVIFFTQEVLKIACSIISQMFEPESLIRVSTIDYSSEAPQLFLPAIQLLKDNGLRDTRLEISSEEVKAYTDESYKQRIVELWKVVFEMLTQSAQMIQSIPEMAVICKTALMSTVRGYRVGRTTENLLEQAIDAAIRQYQQNQANKGPSVEDKIAQAELTKAQAQAQKVQVDAQKAAAELQLKGSKDNTQNQIEVAKLNAQTEKLQVEKEKLLKDMVVDAEELKIKQQAEDRKELETANEIELAWYAAKNPEIPSIPTIGTRA